MRPLLLLPIAASLLVSAVPARGDDAADPVVDLSWAAPADCPTAESIRGEVARLAGNAASGQRWRADARVEHAPDGPWRLHLETEVGGQRATREFAGATCAELASTLAVVLAIDIDPASAARLSTAPAAAPPPAPAEAPPPPAPAATTAPPPSAPPARERPDDASSSGPSHWLALAASAGADVGVFANPAALMKLGLAWTPGAYRLELDGVWSPPSQVGQAGGTGTFALFGGELTGCWSPLRGRVSVGPCIGAQLGQIQASSAGTDVKSTPASSLWLAGEGGALLVWQVTPALGLRAAVDLVVPLASEKFTIGGGSSYSFAPAPVTAQALLGAEVRFW